ncbi:MAG TPA: hypothetical protein VFN54_09005, partial [Acidimicrobiales bacterium]|nr:hypothetical protein [Acidimicrobiales bacterium]
MLTSALRGVLAAVLVTGAAASGVGASTQSSDATAITVTSPQGRPLALVTLHTGGIDVVAIGLRTARAASVSASSSLALALPRGSTVHALEFVDASTGTPVSGWHCANVAPVTTCTLSGSPLVASAVSQGAGLVAYAEITTSATGPTAASLEVAATLDGAARSTATVPVEFAGTNVAKISLQRGATPVVSANTTGSVEYALTSGATATPAGSFTI